MKEPKFSPRAALTILFATVIFVILLITMIIVGLLGFLLIKAGFLHGGGAPNMMVVLIVLALASILVGTLVGVVFSRFPLRPVNVLIHGMNRLAVGDYKTKINLGQFNIAQRLSASFNTLADELQHTEMLRSDFVNNFSHEFKTPIVSIRGFAKLLQKGNLSDKQQREYLDIIVEESTRLTEMATSVLNLTKIENQGILTELSYFNLSEQVRSCVLLLEKKWSEKNLTINIQFDERHITANEELLKQVWINLLDNAVKFSPNNGEIVISIKDTSENLTVLIKNSGPEINVEDRKRIFDKFWQGDSSHASEGTGIGLSIARRIVELHEGKITVESVPDETIFYVRLRKNLKNSHKF